MPCVCAGISGQQIFINIPLFTFMHTLLSLKYYAPDTRSNVNICHIILSPIPYSILFYSISLSRTSDAMQVSFRVSLSVKWYIRLTRDSNTLFHDSEALSWTKHVDPTSASGLYDENNQYNEHVPCVVVVVCSALMSLSIIFQSYHDGVWLRQEAQCSLLLCRVTEVSCPRHLTLYYTQSHYPNTASTNPSSTPCLSAKAGAASTIFKDFGMSRPGIEPVTSSFAEPTLYRLSYQGRYIPCVHMKKLYMHVQALNI